MLGCGFTILSTSPARASNPSRARIARVGSSSAASSAWLIFVRLSNSGRLAVVILVAAVFLILVIVGVPNADLDFTGPCPLALYWETAL